MSEMILVRMKTARIAIKNALLRTFQLSLFLSSSGKALPIK